MSKPREFWIDTDECIYSEREAEKYGITKENYIHVIEYSKLERLKAENQRLKDAANEFINKTKSLFKNGVEGSYYGELFVVSEAQKIIREALKQYKKVVADE